MIIKSLFGRYERWNPVHPTYGTFWGMGVGIGCGVGWGPGFGPEVIGYVGAGCGAGFNVGVMLLGVGIGLPANCHLKVPHSAFMARSGKADAAEAKSIRGNRSSDGDAWDYVGSQNLDDVQENPFASFPGFKNIESLTGNIKSLPDMNKTLLSRAAAHIFGCLKGVSGGFLPWDRGMPK